jgi:hypothetical protein
MYRIRGVVAEEVDAGLRRELLQLLFEPFWHCGARVASEF